MAGSRRIVVEFLGKDVSAGKTAGQVEGKYSKLGTRMNKVGAVAGKALAGGLLLAGAAAVKAGKAAAEDEAAQSKLANTLRNTTGASRDQIAATEDWISAQGKALGVTDDELRPALAKLVTATKDVGEAQKLAALAMDISAGSGKSLEQVTTALQKGVNGSVGGLSRLGVATKNADGSTKSLNQITKELAKTYKGDAAKAADTTAGKQRKLQVQMGELQEEIGAKLLPVFAKLAEWGLKTISWMDKNQKLVGTLVGVLGGLLGGLWLVVKVTKAYTAVQAAMNVVMAMNPIGLVVIAIAALVAGLIIAYKKSETFRKIVDGAFRGIAAAGKWMWDSVLKPTFKFLINGFLSVVGAIITGAAKAFGWVPKLGPKLKAAAESFSAFRKDVNNQLDGIKDKKVKVRLDEGKTRTQLESLNELLNWTTRGRKVKVNVSSPGVFNPGHNAAGTNSWRGGPTWVGEKGPEIIDAPRGSRITPNHKIGGGGTTINVVVNGALDPTAVAKQVQQVLLKLKRTNGGLELGLA